MPCCLPMCYAGQLSLSLSLVVFDDDDVNGVCMTDRIVAINCLHFPTFFLSPPCTQSVVGMPASQQRDRQAMPCLPVRACLCVFSAATCSPWKASLLASCSVCSWCVCVCVKITAHMCPSRGFGRRCCCGRRRFRRSHDAVPLCRPGCEPRREPAGS